MTDTESDRVAGALQIKVIEVDGEVWLPRPTPLPVSAEIHVWDFSSEISQAGAPTGAGLLSTDEKDRASRFHFERDAQRFSVTRARTRSILAGYLQSDPRELQFAYSDHGKPRVAGVSQMIQFNVSHSADRALLAVAKAQEVGVDIERIRENVEVEELAERFFSSGERRLIRDLKGEGRLSAFFRLWTCKEAFLKAHGAGLSRSLASFEVDLGDSPGQLLRIRDGSALENRWSLVELQSCAGYSAAAVLDGPLRTLQIFRLMSE